MVTNLIHIYIFLALVIDIFLRLCNDFSESYLHIFESIKKNDFQYQRIIIG